jgi:hypothetical protein
LKKEFKGFIAGTIITAIVIAGIPAFAESISKSINVTFNSVKIALSGKAVSIDNLTYKGSTYVKLSSVCDLLGKTPNWDAKTKTINIVDKKNGPDKKAVTQQKETGTDAKKTAKADADKPATAQETRKLEVKSVNSLKGGITVEVLFNGKVDKTTAVNASNYLFTYAYGNNSEVPILAAELDPTGKKVILYTEGQEAATLYQLTISNIKDASGNLMDTYSTKIMGLKSNHPYSDAKPGKNAPFKIKSVTSQNSTTIEFTLNKDIDPNSVKDMVCYIYAGDKNKVNMDVLKAEIGKKSNVAVVTLTKPMSYISYTAEIYNLRDQYGNKVEKTTFAFYGIGADKPRIADVKSISSTSVEVTFTEKMDKTSIESPEKYNISLKENDNEKLNVITASLDSTGKKVILTTGEQKAKEYAIRVQNAFSAFLLPIASQDSVTFTGIGKANADTVKSEVKSANSLTGGTAVEIIFNKAVDKVTAEDIKNYSFAFAYGKRTVLPILSATLDATGTKVTLVTAGQEAATLYELTISNVKDAAGNIMTTYSNKIIGNKSDNPCLDSGNESLRLLSALSSSADTVELTFNKNLDEKTAQDVANYKAYVQYGIKGNINIVKAELCSKHNKVLLTFIKDAKTSETCTIEVSNLKDEQGNIIENKKVTDSLGNVSETAKTCFLVVKNQ